jgi:hypothetical protein
MLSQGHSSFSIRVLVNYTDPNLQPNSVASLGRNF